MMSIKLRDIDILNIQAVDYRCIISRISNCETINLRQNTNLTEKKWNIIKYKNLLQILKITGNLLECRILFSRRCRYCIRYTV